MKIEFDESNNWLETSGVQKWLEGLPTVKGTFTMGPCPNCGGLGHVESPDGQFPCDDCGGVGRIGSLHVEPTET